VKRGVRKNFCIQQLNIFLVFAGGHSIWLA
jgi:hypothetical protein